jgi:Glycosyl hydrolases family 43
MRRKYLTLAWFLVIWVCSPGQDRGHPTIHPGQVWLDTRGHPINAHGGGILFYRGTYYWFGEIKQGKTWRVAGISSWEDYRVDASGVSCYASEDLVQWRYLGVALRPDMTDSLSDLHFSKVVERPKVIYNSKTGQFVMWMHIDHQDYRYARAGVAVSDRPEGPYRYLGSTRPNGQESRDITLFQDLDSKAYLIYASEDNRTMQICLLSADYLRPTSTYKRILVDAHREAPAMFSYQGKYYLTTSLCTGWDPNAAMIARSDSGPLGEWIQGANPCTGPGSATTYQAQSNFVLPIQGQAGRFIFMADRWNKTNLEDSRYVWLPLSLEEGTPTIRWTPSWSPSQP